MGFSTINIHCNVISGVKDNGNSTDILYTFTLTEPPSYSINTITTNILYENVTKGRIEYIGFHITDEHGRPIEFNGDLLSFTLHLIWKRLIVILIDIDLVIVILIVIDLVIDLIILININEL